MKREYVAGLITIAGCISGPGLAVIPMALGPPRFEVVFVQDNRDLGFAALDAQLEAAALTAALIRAYDAVLALTEENLKLTAVLRRLARENDSTLQEQTHNAMLLREAEIRGAVDTALESYLRLIGETENSYSQEDITARIAAVDRAMGFRGQGSIKSALPAILLHIRLIHNHATPSREAVLKDIRALANQ